MRGVTITISVWRNCPQFSETSEDTHRLVDHRNLRTDTHQRAPTTWISTILQTLRPTKHMNPSQRLSSRDAGVLNFLFDPESLPPLEDSNLIDQTTPDQPLNTEQLAEVKVAEQRAIHLAEEGAIDEAEKLLTRTIHKYPNGRPSLWSNRAQVRRLSKNVAGALDDLSQTIRIATPPKNAPPSNDNAKLLSFAYTHRATIYMLVARGEISGVLNDESHERLEGYASHDFAMAGRYGSELGRAMAVRTNPYAKLCGAIVQTALKKEMQPFV